MVRNRIMSYKHELEKGSKKHICPSCNKKRYVRYVNIETNEYAAYNFGRCDRETSCGYFVKPSDNLITNGFIPALNIRNNKISYIENTIPKTTFKHFKNNNFFIFLTKYFNKELVLDTLKKYNVGTSKKWNGSTVFWQEDTKNQFRTGKIMLYNKETGKRVKKPYTYINWVHSVLKLDSFILKQCLFGLHLTKEKNKVIGLVEAEKTAITMDMFLPECNWLATGSKQNLKEELLNPIKSFRIILYPDKGEFNDWQEKCNQLIKKGFNISCSNLVEKSTLVEGSDLADIYFNLENNTENIPLSKTETLAQKMYSKNPAIKNLIDTFILTEEAGNNIRSDLFS